MQKNRHNKSPMNKIREDNISIKIYTKNIKRGNHKLPLKLIFCTLSLHLKFRFRRAILYGHKTIQESLLVIFVYYDDLQRPRLDFIVFLLLNMKLFNHKLLTSPYSEDVSFVVPLRKKTLW